MAACAGCFAFNRIDCSYPYFLMKELVPQLALLHISFSSFSISVGILCLRGSNTGHP